MYWLLTVIPIVLVNACPDVVQTDKEEALRYLEYLDKKVCQAIAEDTFADYNFYTNATEYNRQIMAEQDAKGDLDDVQIVEFDWVSFNDSDLYRQAKFYGLFEKSIDPQLVLNYSDLISQMTYINGVVDDNICLYKNRTNCGDAGWEAILTLYTDTRDTDELAFYWNESMKIKPLLGRPLYEPFVNISNTIDRMNGFANSADSMLSSYEVPTVNEFECVVMDLWKQIEPFYKQYHAFCRKRLRKIYGEAAVSKKGPIPIHLYGLQLGLEVGSRLKEAQPYPEKPTTNLTDQLQQQYNSTYDMAKLVEKFFHSLGLGYLPDSFWKGSMFSRPRDRPVDCFTSSFNFMNRKDYRMLVCARVNQGSLQSMAHEMGHIYSFIGVQNQTCCYRDVPTAGFAEALAEMMMAFFMSYGNLQALNLVPQDSTRDPETEINDLFFLARDGIASLPFVLLIDLWRFNVFRNNILPDNYNKAYWDLRRKIQGVVPPFPRGEEYLDAIDVGYVAMNQEYIGYFVENIVMYQMIEYICTKTSEYDPSNPNSKPLHHCNIYNSTIAGDILRDVYALGKSKPWLESLKLGSFKPFMDAGPLLRYFDPVYQWLLKENQRTGEYIGWE